MMDPKLDVLLRAIKEPRGIPSHDIRADQRWCNAYNILLRHLHYDQPAMRLLELGRYDRYSPWSKSWKRRIPALRCHLKRVGARYYPPKPINLP